MGVVFYEMWRQPFFTAMERAQVQLTQWICQTFFGPDIV